jgi:hypothetical protein
MANNPNENDVKLTDNYRMEDDFLYFCMWDDGMGILSSRCPELPAIENSCYVDCADVFPAPNS